MRKREMKELSALRRTRCPDNSGQGVRITQDKVSGIAGIRTLEGYWMIAM